MNGKTPPKLVIFYFFRVNNEGRKARDKSGSVWKMTSNSNISDSEKSVEMNAPGEESIDITPENTMDTPSGQACNSQTKHVYEWKKRNSNGHGDSANVSAGILAAIQELFNKHDKTFRKITVIEFMTEATSQRIEKLLYSWATCGGYEPPQRHFEKDRIRNWTTEKREPDSEGRCCWKQALQLQMDTNYTE